MTTSTLFVRYCIAGVWHRIDFVRVATAQRFYAAVCGLVPRHVSAVEYHDTALPARVTRRAA